MEAKVTIIETEELDPVGEYTYKEVHVDVYMDCPYCGSKEITVDDAEENFDAATYDYVTCDSCGKSFVVVTPTWAYLLWERAQERKEIEEVNHG